MTKQEAHGPCNNQQSSSVDDDENNEKDGQWNNDFLD